MTTRDGFDRTPPEFDRLMTAWLDAESRVREPDGLFERTVARTSRVRPRPAWLLPERWLPMELTMRPVRLPRTVGYVGLLVLIILVAAAAILAVASRRNVPQPFGPATNGRIAIVRDGQIATVDPVSGDARLLVDRAANARDHYPVFSRDGTRIAFVRSTPAGDDVYAVAADGGPLMRLTSTPVSSAGLLVFSPDGTRLAFQNGADLLIADGDGSGVHRVDIGMPVDAEIAWRPGREDELVVRGLKDGLAGLALVKLDGSPVRTLTAFDGGQNDYLWVSWSSDGTRLAYHIEPRREIHVLSIDRAAETVFHPTSGMGLMFPRFSPDGTKLASMAWHTDGSVQVAVFAADDPIPELTLTGPRFGSGIQFDWSPDGTQILVAEWNSSEPWILDPAGGPGTRTPWSAAFPDWVEWQRRASP